MKFGLLIAIIFLAFVLPGCATAPYQKGLAPVSSVKEKNHVTARFRRGGINLFEQWWLPEGGSAKSKAAVIFVHGLKDHSRRYAETAKRLAHKNYSVYAFDLRGHGDSEGQRVWVDSFDDYIKDLEVFYDLVAKKEPNKPIFIFGHSMGGAIVTIFAIKKIRPVAGIILSAPAIRPTEDVGFFTITSARIAGTLTPSLAVLKLEPEKFSRDQAVVKATKEDPLIYQENGPARTARELFGAMSYIQEHMHELNVPFIAMHGQKDYLTNYMGSTDLFQKARTKTKTIKLYPETYHDLLHEPEKDKIYEDILTWLEARTAIQTTTIK